MSEHTAGPAPGAGAPSRTLVPSMMSRPIFIGGLMKSGTTLLRSLLGQHPNLYSTFETHWFADAISSHWDQPHSKRMALLLELLELDEPTYRTLCEQKRSAPEREFIDIVMEYCCRRAGKHRWIEKTPDNIRHRQRIFSAWPDAVLCHVTREYKDVYASWKIRRKDSLATFLNAAAHAYDDIEDLLGSESPRYMEVDYQDLVLNTEATLRRVLEHVGEPWDPACAVLDVDEGERSRTRFRNLLGRESWTLVSLSKSIFSTSIGQWREHLDTAEIQAIELTLASRYEQFGQRWQDDSAGG